MEDQIKKAENATSTSGETCKWIGCFVATVGALIVVWPELNVPESEARFGGFFACIGGGAALAALGSNSTSNKRTSELTALLVRSTNSASELPMPSKED